MRNKKLQVWLPLLFSLVLIAGMYFGFKLKENNPAARGFLRNDKRTALQEVLDLVRLKYVDPVKLDSLQYDAVHEMMSHLDPHSVFIPATQLKEVNEDITGNFDGIGVEFNIFSDTVHILYVLPGGPSDKAGLEVGDRIIKVEGRSITGSTVGSEDVKKLIRGEKNSTVTLTIIRNGQQQKVAVTRGSIPLPALDASYMLNNNTGYLRLNKFSESAYEEFMRELEEMKKKGLVNLVLDLRGNGGGLMNEAVQIADEFIGGKKLLVYTEGLHSRRQNYESRRPGLFEEGKLYILVDELSASASEVLAGAIQDWDRGTIIGRRTFGKGLVQEQYPLSDGSAIRLTVARYYTPAGRSIQRSYEKGKKEYLDEIRGRINNGSLLNADSNHVENGKTYRTIVKKRVVYGGGGIMPDVFVPMDTSTIPRQVSRILVDGSFNNFVYNYYIRNQDKIAAYSSATQFNAEYNNLEEAWNLLLLAFPSEAVMLKQLSAQDKEFIKTRIKAQLARFRWRVPGFFEVTNANDPVLKKVKELVSSDTTKVVP